MKVSFLFFIRKLKPSFPGRNSGLWQFGVIKNVHLSTPVILGSLLLINSLAASTRWLQWLRQYVRRNKPALKWNQCSVLFFSSNYGTRVAEENHILLVGALLLLPKYFLFHPWGKIKDRTQFSHEHVSNTLNFKRKHFSFSMKWQIVGRNETCRNI